MCARRGGCPGPGVDEGSTTTAGSTLPAAAPAVVMLLVVELLLSRFLGLVLRIRRAAKFLATFARDAVGVDGYLATAAADAASGMWLSSRPW